MAATEFSSTAAQARKVWSDQVWADMIHKTEINRFMGTGDNAILRRLTDLESERGDTIRYDIRLQLDDWGVVGSTRLKGAEDSLAYAQDSVVLNQRRMGVKNMRLSQQRTVHDLKLHAREALTDRWADYIDNLMFAILAGKAQDTPTGLSAAYTAEGLTPVAADAAHIIDSASDMVLASIDRLVERAKESSPLIRPAMVDGQPKYILVLHPAAVRGLRAETGASGWTEIAARANVRGATNPIYTGALGEYNVVILHESPRIPYDPAGGATDPHCWNLFLGANAGVIAFGNAYSGLGLESPTRVDALASWFEDTDDYGEEWGFAVGAIYGIKKVRFDMGSGSATDYGVIVLQTDDEREVNP